MKGSFLFKILLISILSNTYCYAQTETYAKIKIYFDESHTIQSLSALGVEADHGRREKTFLINDFSATEINQIQHAGFKTETLIENVSDYYANQNSNLSEEQRANTCGKKNNIKKPKRFRLGKMAGYYPYNDMIAILDSMRLAYPKLISVRTAITGSKTHENRPIYWFRISDNPDIEEKTEPQVLYTALHHAREPGSVSQMIYYMWYLLENYDTNPEIKFLVNNTELYFVPCVNPDGYIHNETTNPNGGGLWRKNRRKNTDGSFGVDLNRNYGFKWAYDSSGSSGTPAAETYRGPSAFSEPETKAMKTFCDAHTFLTAHNYHSYGNLLIYPWSYLDAVASPDFVEYGKLLVAKNNYKAGSVTETVGYQVNGDSDDWMYGDTSSKKAIIVFTPEVSESSFWAPASTIISTCDENLRSNLDLAFLTHNYAVAEDLSARFLTAKTGNLSLSLKRYGLQNGPVSVQVKSLSANASTNNTVKVLNLKKFETSNLLIPYTLNNNVKNFENINFLVSVNNGEVVITDTLKKVFILDQKIWTDNSSNINNWNVNNTWGTTTSTYTSAPSCITDSPVGNYGNNALNTITTKTPIDLKGTTRAVLQFQAKWDLEPQGDNVQIKVSTDGFGFESLCGKYTHDGDYTQAKDLPIYDGTQSNWVSEEVDLSNYIGKKVWIRFELNSDGFTVFDGFYFDDLSIITDKNVTAVHDLNEFEFKAIPNPTSNEISIQNIDNEPIVLHLFDISGKQLLEKTIQSSSEKISLDGIPNGVYIYRLYRDGQAISVQKLVVSK
jgi:carboxypeptidase T